MVKKLSFRNPYLTVVIVFGVLAFFEIAVFARIVMAQGAAKTDADFDVFKLIQLVSTIFAALGFAATFVWYVVRGKSNDQLVKNNQDLQTSNSELRAKLAEIKTEIAEMKAEYSDIERENERLRKANLRLQGINDQ